MRIGDRIAIVTGAAQGIGQAVAMGFAHERPGWRLAI